NTSLARNPVPLLTVLTFSVIDCVCWVMSLEILPQTPLYNYETFAEPPGFYQTDRRGRRSGIRDRNSPCAEHSGGRQPGQKTELRVYRLRGPSDEPSRMDCHHEQGQRRRHRGPRRKAARQGQTLPPGARLRP